MDSILTVVTAAATQDLTRLDTVLEELNLTAGDAKQDRKLRRRIAEASQVIVRYCNRVFGRETVEETFTLECSSNHLPLQRYPVTAIASITVNGEALTAEDFEVAGQPGLLYPLAAGTRSSWPRGRIVVRYTGGYELLTGLPPDIELACIKLVTLESFAGGRDPLVRSETVEGIGAVGYALPGAVGGMDGDGLPGDVARKLDPYRRVTV